MLTSFRCPLLLAALSLTASCASTTETNNNTDELKRTDPNHNKSQHVKSTQARSGTDAGPAVVRSGPVLSDGGGQPAWITGEPIELMGTVSFGFELSAFLPCGGDESWWLGGIAFPVEADAGVTSSADAGVTAPAATDINFFSAYHIRGTGVLSPKGMYGHFGQSKHEVRFTHVDEMFQISAGETEKQKYCPQRTRSVCGRNRRTRSALDIVIL